MKITAAWRIIAFMAVLLIATGAAAGEPRKGGKDKKTTLVVQVKEVGRGTVIGDDFEKPVVFVRTELRSITSAPVLVSGDNIILKGRSGESSTCYFGWKSVSGVKTEDCAFESAELDGEPVYRITSGAVRMDFFAERDRIEAVFAFVDAPSDDEMTLSFPGASRVSVRFTEGQEEPIVAEQEASDEAKPDSEDEESPEQKAWKGVDSMDRRSLQSFLKRFPKGALARDAKTAVELQDRLSGIRQGRIKGVFTIPLNVLGDRWRVWQKKNPEKGVVGYSVKKSNGYNTLGFFLPEPLTGGMTGGKSGTSFSFDELGILMCPTGDGSIAAFRTDGVKFELYSGIMFQTPGREPMYFGVIKGKGLVHLKGKGKVFLPNRKTVELK